MTGRPRTLADLVEAQVRRTPAAPAVVAADGGAWSFAELEARANRLAHRLRALGVGPDVAVGACLERSPGMAAGLLGILKAGGACLPLDPAYPEARLAHMLDDASPPVVVTTAPLAARLPPHRGAVVRLDEDGPALERHPDTPPERDVGPEHLAYVIYTSGSTGRPRGVMLPHGALVNHALAAIGLYRLGPGDRVLQFCSISFDVSVEELFPTWAAGASAVLRPDDVPLLGRDWDDWLERRAVTVLNLPTAYWHDWVRDLAARGRSLPPAVRLVVAGGERALAAALRRWREVAKPDVRWVNAYGPTEAAVMATTWEAGEGAGDDGRDPPIGGPLPGVTVHVLDEAGRPVERGEAGELYIGGAGLARGYLNQPELTARRFVPDPFSPSPGARLYRTGDLVREGPDGMLEFLGRTDQQVKVRGFRIECGEVEAAVAAHPGVDQAVVVAREPRPGHRELVAYVVPAAGERADAGDLRRHVAGRLPAWMVPAAFVTLDALPVTPNGKVDRDALPAPDRSAGRGAGRPPAPGTEEAVASVWREVLGLDAVGADDDFFALGGHSLAATQAVARLRELAWPDAPLQAIFEAPTVAELATALDRRASAAATRPPLVAQRRAAGESLPLSLPQEQMWGLEVAADPPGLYNVTAQHRFESDVDPAVVARAVEHLAARHEALRTWFVVDGGRPRQVVADSVAVDLEVHDLAGLAGGDQNTELRRLVGDQDARPFDLSAPPLFRAALYRLGGTAELAVTFDHLVCDGTSAFVFLSELAAAHRALAAGREPALRPLPLQYADFALWQRRWVTDERLEEQLAYWREKLAGMPLGPALPFDRVPERPTRRISSRPLAVPPAVHRAVTDLARSSSSTGFVVVTAAVQAVLARLGGRTDVVVSTTLSGRQRAELEGVIGFFAGIGRIRTDLSGDPTFATVLARVRESVLGLFDHQDVPFMRVRQALFPDFPGPGAGGGVGLLAALPVDLQYFRAAADEWAPGSAVVSQPAHRKGADRLWFRGQMHPLALTLLDDGREMWGEVSWKVDFYDDATIAALADGFDRLLRAAVADPGRRLSELPA